MPTEVPVWLTPTGTFVLPAPERCRGTVSVVTPEDVVAALTARFVGLVPKASWGETSLFYNPDALLPNGVYFATIKDHDGANDSASHLDRPGVFRVALGLPRASYERLFGLRPVRPPRGGVVVSNHDFTAIDVLMPHPVYAWMGWVQVLSPSTETFTGLQSLLDEAYDAAVAKYTVQAAKRARADR
jgi:hypothetical protein